MRNRYLGADIFGHTKRFDRSQGWECIPPSKCFFNHFFVYENNITQTLFFFIWYVERV